MCNELLFSVNMSESADYVAKNTDFQYSLVVHLTIEKNENSTRISKVDYTLLKALEDENHYFLVEPVMDPEVYQSFRLEFKENYEKGRDN